MGRKKLPNVKRTASGRISRSRDAYAENIGPFETRMRLFGLSEKDARDQKASTFIGRLQLTGEVSQIQYDGSQEFLAVREKYQRAIKSPDALRSSDGGGDQGESETYERWCRVAVARYEAAMHEIRSEQNLPANRGRNLYAAVDHVVCRGQPMWHMVPDCRVALNALVRHFGLAAKSPLDDGTQIAA